MKTEDFVAKLHGELSATEKAERRQLQDAALQVADLGEMVRRRGVAIRYLARKAGVAVPAVPRETTARASGEHTDLLEGRYPGNIPIADFVRKLRGQPVFS